MAILLILISLAVLALHFLGYVNPGPGNWGVHSFGFLSQGWLTAGLAAGLVAGILAGFSRGGWVRSRAVVPGLLVLGGVLFWLGRERILLLGDGRYWVDAVTRNAVQWHADPGSLLVVDFLQGVTGLEPVSAFMGVSVLCGLIYLVAVVGFARSISTGAGVGIAFALPALAGLTRMFYGYVELFPLVAALTAVFLTLAVRYVRGDGRVWPLALLAGLAPWVDVTAILLWPALIVLLWIGPGGTPGGRGKRLTWLLLPAGLAAVMLLLIARSPSSVGSLYEPYLQKLLPPLRPWNAHVPYGFLSLEHLKDILQEQMLVGPFAALVALVLLLVGGGRRLGREGVVLLAAGIPWWGAGLMINRQIGAARDWDLFAVGLLPWIFLVALMVARRIDQGITRPWAVAQGLLVGVSVFHLLGWVAVDTRADTSIDRFAALNAPQGSSVSPWARSYAYEELGLYYLFAGDSEGAVAAFTESVLADSTNYRSAANLGRAFLNVGRADAAVQVLELTQTRNPFGAEIAFELGRAYAVKGWLVEARESHRRAIANRPDYLEAYINLASVEQRLGDLVQARSTLIEARRRWPDSALVHAQLGRVEVDIGNTEAAFASFARALELDPNDTPTLFNRGLLYRKGRDTEAAVRDFKALIALDPTDYEARINLAATYEEAGRVDEAAGVYAKAQDLQPERAEAYFYLARFHLGRQDTTAAREVLSRYVARDSTSNNGLAATRLLRILEGGDGGP